MLLTILAFSVSKSKISVASKRLQKKPEEDISRVWLPFLF